MSGCSDERGLTLAELVVAAGVTGLLMAAVLTVFQSGLRGYTWGAARVEAQQFARAALERMARELREAGYDPTGAGIAAVVVAEPARVAFQRDLNGNGVVDPTSERVTFLLRPGEGILRREAGGGAQPLAEGIRRFRLDYFDRAGAATSDPVKVAAVRLRVETAPPPRILAAGAGVIMETEVTIRNALR